MAKLKTFSVMAKCYRDVTIKIKAESLEDAIVRARAIDEEKFVSVLGDYNDGSTTVYGVFES